MGRFRCLLRRHASLPNDFRMTFFTPSHDLRPCRIRAGLPAWGSGMAAPKLKGGRRSLILFYVPSALMECGRGLSSLCAACGSKQLKTRSLNLPISEPQNPTPSGPRARTARHAALDRTARSWRSLPRVCASARAPVLRSPRARRTPAAVTCRCD